MSSSRSHVLEGSDGLVLPSKGWRGVMAVDPGKTTGVAWGLFPTNPKWTVKKRVARALARSAAHPAILGSKEVTGHHVYQAMKLYGMWRAFRAAVPLHVPCTLVSEDFVLRVGSASSDRDQLYPVRINAALEALAMAGVAGGLGWRPAGDALDLGGDLELAIGAAMEAGQGSILYQSPSAAKSYCTDERLKRYELWQVGSRHCRDAWRHCLLHIAGEL